MQRTEGHILTPNGFRLYYQKSGSGRDTVILPNGFYLFDDFQHLARNHTLISYDPRNRGRSDTITDSSQLSRGIHNDVDDLEIVRLYFGADRAAVIGHSYMGLVAALYAMRFPAHAGRVVQLGPMPPNLNKQYPASADPALTEAFSKIAQLQQQRESYTPEEFCRKFWSMLKRIYVVNPADAGKLKWDRCDLPNELNFMKYWTGGLLPSIQCLNLTPKDFAKVTIPVLIVHGVMDRSAPYGGAKDWARLLPNARLLTVEKAGHAPWIENPDRVFTSIESFLNGAWPETAEQLQR